MKLFGKSKTKVAACLQLNSECTSEDLYDFKPVMRKKLRYVIIWVQWFGNLANRNPDWGIKVWCLFPSVTKLAYTDKKRPTYEAI